MDENDDRLFRKWEVLKRWGVDSRKLAEYVCDGLYAYDRDGRKLPTIEDHAHTLAFRYSEEEFLTYLADRIAWFIIDDIKDFEHDHGIEVKTEPVNSSITNPASQEKDDYNIRKGVALQVARSFKKKYPNLTQKEAAKAINDCLVNEHEYKSYSEKHLIRIISPLGFLPGKPGRKPKK
jgi:hypothetical protein